ILAHEHMQGGNYEFAMAKAGIRKKITFAGYENVSAGIVKWPMSVIRLRSGDRASLEACAARIFDLWDGYTDESAFIFANTNGEPHNAITPIVRRRGDEYEVDLVLRNNITTDEHPLGVYHPHADKHNIKKENIGLIEVMGLAVLPSRLKSEMSALAEIITSGGDIRADERTAKHADWAEKFMGNYSINEENVNEILQKEIGRTFVEVLADAGVFKDNEDGHAAFDKFIDFAGGR
ncbi:MAG: galactose-1-phosphate uridylyltransferase, partial [Clostridiales bacterium]|nr:galactose-1-phosphate uridylyltransferase [Clostridiales bacterium]